MPEHGLYVQAEIQQAHEKVQGASKGWGKRETAPQQHGEKMLKKMKLHSESWPDSQKESQGDSQTTAQKDLQMSSQGSLHCSVNQVKKEPTTTPLQKKHSGGSSKQCSSKTSCTKDKDKGKRKKHKTHKLK